MSAAITVRDQAPPLSAVCTILQEGNYLKRMVHGAWCMVYGAWCMVYGAWCMVHGVWCMVYGAWCMVYGV